MVRNDLLIGFHLALDLTRDTLVLQMMRRDQKKGTRIHRVGGWGHDIVDCFSWNASARAPLAILDLIARSGEAFDALASRLSSTYVERGPLLLPVIESARDACHKSTTS